MTTAMSELASLDELSRLDSFWHRLHPLGKLLLTIAYIAAVLSFPVNDIAGLFPMLLFPLIGYALSTIPVHTCFYKLRYLIPLVAFVGIWNPILNRAPAFTIGALTVSEGMVSFITLMLKGIYSLMASFLLIATTGIESLCYALRMLHVPKILVTALLITYRYISLLLSEAAAMSASYALRAPGEKGVRYKAWGSFLGSLLLRSMDRAQALYHSMQMRGFAGEFYYARKQTSAAADFIVFFAGLGLILLFRLVPVVTVIGRLFV